MSQNRSQAQPWCKHCGKVGLTRSRGLCYACYQNYEIRKQYGSYTKVPFGSEFNLDSRSRPLPLPDQPTEAVPGSEQKVAIMEQRLQSGRSIFHPHDYTWDRDFELLDQLNRE